MVRAPRGVSACDRSCMTAGTVKTRAAIATRVVTAAAGVQPVASRLAANEPDVANVAPDRRAIARPTLLTDPRTTCPPMLAVRIYECYAAYSVQWLVVRSQVLFAHDTEVALQAAAALVNTDERDG